MAAPLVFRIFYSTLFSLLNLILLILVLITPGDAIRQALSNHQLYNVFVIAGCYVLTLFLAIIILSSRFYTNRSVLAAIPKTWIPVEKSDVKSSVRKMIVESLSRSAAIAWDARPRIDNINPANNNHGNNLYATTTTATAITATSTLKAPATTTSTFDTTPQKKKRRFLRRPNTAESTLSPITSDDHTPVWGTISHAGWTSPFSPDLPNLHYATVIAELPHLIEAKAVSLAPPDPELATLQNQDQNNGSLPIPDVRVVELLQRGVGVGLRDYISHLGSLGVITDGQAAATFLKLYEQARFAGFPLSEEGFRELMAAFAGVLRGMKLDVGALAGDEGSMLSTDSSSGNSSIRKGGSGSNAAKDIETDIDDDASSKSTPMTMSERTLSSRGSQRTLSLKSWVGSEGTMRTARSRSRPRPPIKRNTDSGSFFSKKRPPMQQGSGSWASAKSFGFGAGGGGGGRLVHKKSMRSLRRASTATSNNSVIRLRGEGEGGEEYVITP